MGKNSKQTSPKVASLAAKTLQSPSSSGIQKTMAASALRQSGGSAQTGGKTEGKASAALDNSRSSSTTKILAASVLSQSNRKR
ncbi:hypothetical protein GCS91_03990 [Delftia tsuruhatensis]|jgi:hypothetical protein|nr:hypothetical protein GCS91_03990 [Delftia tsuruhatensis]